MYVNAHYPKKQEEKRNEKTHRDKRKEEWVGGRGLASGLYV